MHGRGGHPQATPLGRKVPAVSFQDSNWEQHA